MLKIAKIALLSAMLTVGVTACGDKAPDPSVAAKVYSDGLINADAHKMLSVMDLSDVSEQQQAILVNNLGKILKTTAMIAEQHGGFAKYIVTDVKTEGNEAVAAVKLVFKDGTEKVSTIPLRLTGDRYSVVFNQSRAEASDVCAEDLVSAEAPSEQPVATEDAQAPAAPAEAAATDAIPECETPKAE